MDIYIARGEERKGPYSEDAIRQFLADGLLDGSELAWQEGLDEWVNLWEFLKGLRALDEETLSQVGKIKELIADGHEDTALQLVRSLNNPRIYEGLLADCPVDDDGRVSVPEFLSRNGDLFIKLLGNLPEGKLQHLNLRNLLNVDLALELPYQINDVSALGELTSLKELTELTKLILRYNKIGDVNALKELKQLTWLTLWGNHISDVSAMKELTQLTYLNLGRNMISDVSALRKLTQLKDLILAENQISDVSALEELTRLEELHLYDNQISDVTPLKELTQLTRLSLGYNQISDVSALAGLTQLTELKLDGNADLTKKQIDALREALPRCEIIY